MALPSADVDVLGNGLLIMRLMQPGDVSKPKVNKGELVDFEVLFLGLDGEDHPGRGQRTFRVGEGDECDALECVAPLLRPGDTVAIRTIPGAFCLDKELCKARPTARVEAVVKLTRVEVSTPVIERSLSARIAEAKKKKNRGNFLFGREEYQAAAVPFGQGLSYISEACHRHVTPEMFEGKGDEVISSEDSKAIEEALSLCCSLYTNLALTQLNIAGEAANAVSTCNAALILQPDNVKALYLKAKTMHAAKVDPEEQVTVLQRAIELSPDNEAAKSLLTTVQDEMYNQGSPMFTWIWLIISTVVVCLALYLQNWYYYDPELVGVEAGWMRGDDVTPKHAGT